MQEPDESVVQLLAVPVDQLPLTVAPDTGVPELTTGIVSRTVQPPWREVATAVRGPMLIVPDGADETVTWWVTLPVAPPLSVT